MSISFTFFVESLAKGVTFSVLRDSFTKANIGLTYMGTRNVVFFSHFNIFTLRMQLHIFFKDGFAKKRDISFVRQTFIGCFSRDVCQSNGLHQRFCWENLLDFPP